MKQLLLIVSILFISVSIKAQSVQDSTKKQYVEATYKIAKLSTEEQNKFPSIILNKASRNLTASALLVPVVVLVGAIVAQKNPSAGAVTMGVGVSFGLCLQLAGFGQLGKAAYALRAKGL
jgi:hypothetical protein